MSQRADYVPSAYPEWTVAEQTVSPEESPASAQPVVGWCTDTKHPALTGRVRVRWKTPGGAERERWLPCVHGLTVRENDRVLVQPVANWPQPIVVGVVDGFAMRPEAPFLPGPTVTLERDETVRVETREGQRLLEIRSDDSGPIVRLLDDDVSLDLKGRMKIKASSIAIQAKQGAVKITATNDVEVQGETVKLN